MVGSLCTSLPQSELWRLAGFGRVSAGLTEVTPGPTDSYLTLPIDVAFSLAKEQNLPILGSAIDTYNAVLKRNFALENRFDLPLSDSDFFEGLNLDFPGMETVKAAVLTDDIPTAKTAYTTFRCQFLKDCVGGVSNPDAPLLERSDTYTTAKTYLECLLRLSIHPTPVIRATTEIGIAAHLFPEFRGSEHLLKLTLQRYQWIIDAFFHADGFHKDRTLRSQAEAVADFARFLSVYGDFKELRAALEKLVAACTHLSRPDCSFPPLGALPAPNFDAVELCALADSPFKCPDTTSHALPETDCYVMRDNWEPDGQYLFFDALPKGESENADISRLALYAHGRHLATGAVRLLGRTPTVSDVLDTQWIATSAFDFVEKWWQAAAVHHKRGIFYLKGEYFILHDLVLGAEGQTLEQTFYFGGGIGTHIDADAGYTWTEDTRRSNLFIGATDPTDLTVALAEDSVIYRRNNESAAALNTLLFPMRPDIKVHPTLSALEVHTDPDVLGTGFTLALPNTTDTFLISDDGLTEMSTEAIRCVAEYLFLRRDASGGVQFIMLNGRFLKVGPKVLADLAEPRESYVQM